jgi:DNA (cytosine-5)-methyltransferase 1
MLAGGLADTDGGNSSDREKQCSGEQRQQPCNHWSDFQLIQCSDGKARRIGPGIHPLAHGVSARVVRLRGYGNAINPWIAAEFVKAYIEAGKESAVNP